MALHATAKKRIAIVVTITVAICLALAGIWLYRQNERQDDLAKDRQEGLAFYEQGDYHQALEPLERYARRDRTDIPAMYKLVDVYENVPSADGRNIGNAIFFLKQIVNQDPGYKDSADKLLGYYLQYQQTDEALILSGDMLERDPNNIEALRAQAITQARLRHFDKALEATDKIIALKPDDFEIELLRIKIQSQLETPPAKMIEEANALAAKFPDDPRYNVILALAYQNAQDSDKVDEYLTKAIANPVPDDKYINTLIQFLDTNNRFSNSLEVLQKVSTESDNPLITSELITRYMEHARYQDALKLIGDIDPTDPSISYRVIMYQVIAYNLTNQRDLAQKDIDALEDRKNVPAATTLAKALSAIFDRENHDPILIIKTTEEAIKLHPQFAYLHLFLGDAYAETGNTEKATEEWQAAARLRSSWAQPFMQLALLELREKNFKEAQAYATAAAARDNSNPNIAGTWVLASSANLQPGDTAAAERILDVIQRLENRGVQGGRLMEMKLRLLEKTGDTAQAKTIITEALAKEDTKDLTQPILLSMAELSRAMKLDLTDQILDKYQTLYGMTPQLALAKAHFLTSQGKTEEGLNLLKQLKSQYQDKDPINWEITWATYLSTINDPQAVQAWEILAEQNPKNASVQQLTIRALSNTPAASASVQQALMRLESLTGNTNPSVMLEQARLLLLANSANRDPQKAIAILQKLIEQSPSAITPHLLIARAYQETGQNSLALKELSNIAKNNPNNPGIAIDLARTYQSIKAFELAADQLNTVRQSKTATPEQIRQAVQMYAAQNEDALAIETVQRLKDATGNYQDQDLLLVAALYERQNLDAQVQPLITMMEKDPTPNNLAWRADYYADKGDKAKAEQMIDALKRMDIPETQRAQMLSNYAARHEGIDKAIEYDIQLTEQQPNNPGSWNRLITRYLTLGDADDAIATAKRGLTHLPNQASLQAIVQHEAVIKQITDQPIYRAIIIGLLRDPESRTASDRMLTIIASSRLTEEKATVFADKIRPLAKKYPDNLAIQILLAEIDLKTGRFQQAAETAKLVMANFPRSAEAARIATDAEMALGNWNDAIVTANQWITRSPDSKIEASLRIAAAQLALKQPYNAIRTLRPYAQQATEQPDEFPQIIQFYGQALASDNRIDEAEAFFKPLITENATWRIVAMRAASSVTKHPKPLIAWMDQILQAIPQTELAERATFAEALFTIANRFDLPADKQRANDIIDQIVSQQGAPANAWFVRGVINESSGNLTDAAESYRETIKLNPNFAPAKNNLAFILHTQNKDTAQALTLAEQAVNASPSNPSFLDTLAAIQAGEGDYTTAIATQKRAVNSDPNNPLWRVNLLKIYEQADMTQEATDLRQQLKNQGIVKK
ncbi:tetratricopeptide repeat protein [Poriferisphaera sp. WC338]|uniref:tetratricopeptide repeat protein n=1 Tax=Poriferisphaera sp. WC338 TaxID=3425129 RepID=UPI003D81A3C1